jgi:glycosyltransferase involved in cell wall biosynthesis
VVVLPNRVPERLLPMPRESDGRTLGWGGLASGHPGDLQAAHGGAGRALAGSGWRFLVIGPAEGVRIGLGLTQAVDATGGLSLEGYHEALGSLDVGIAPLNPSPFNRAKSGLKCLEYAARGVPYVASPSPEYTLLAGEGVGLLATDALQWRRHLTDLMQDETLREHHREHGRAVIAEKHTYERHGHLWPEAWESAMRNRDQRRSGMCSERPVSRKRSLVGPGSVRREAAP